MMSTAILLFSAYAYKHDGSGEYEGCKEHEDSTACGHDGACAWRDDKCVNEHGDGGDEHSEHGGSGEYEGCKEHEDFAACDHDGACAWRDDKCVNEHSEHGEDGGEHGGENGMEKAEEEMEKAEDFMNELGSGAPDAAGQAKADLQDTADKAKEDLETEAKKDDGKIFGINKDLFGLIVFVGSCVLLCCLVCCLGKMCCPHCCQGNCPWGHGGGSLMSMNVPEGQGRSQQPQVTNQHIVPMASPMLQPQQPAFQPQQPAFQAQNAFHGNHQMGSPMLQAGGYQQGNSQYQPIPMANLPRCEDCDQVSY